MTVWDVFAQVANGKVKNIVVGEAYNVNEATKAEYGADALSILVSNPDYPVEIGDDYHDGKFWHNGEEIKARPTEAQRVKNLETLTRTQKNQITDLNDAIDDLIIAITPTEE